MKKSEIKVGGLYAAKVNEKLVTVRVDNIGSGFDSTTYYNVTNLSTGRQTTFRSAAKFRSPVSKKEAEQRPDPSTGASTAASSTSSITPTSANVAGKTEVTAADKPCLGYDPSLVTNLCRCKSCKDKPREERTGYKAPHRINSNGDCDCGMDGVTCQGCGKRFCGTQSTWQEGKGNLCPSCAPSMDVSTGVPSPQTLIPETVKEVPMEPTPSPKTGLAAKLVRLNTDDTPHLIVEARAGTGKTTTLIEGLKRLKGIPTPGFIPSPQQEKVFQSMELSKGKVNTICFVAFNKSIAEELKSRVPSGCEASTMHAMGFKAIRKSIRLNNSNAVNADRVQKIIEEITGTDIWELRRKEAVLVQATQKLVGLCKMNLTDAGDKEELARLAAHYDVELNGQRDKVFDLVPKVLDRCKDVERDGFIDYDDMVWLPVALNLPVTKYDLLLVDEAQDLNRCQQALAKKAGRRLVLCGDPKQAIYGFAGADAESMPRMTSELGFLLRKPGGNDPPSHRYPSMR